MINDNKNKNNIRTLDVLDFFLIINTIRYNNILYYATA